MKNLCEWAKSAEKLPFVIDLRSGKDHVYSSVLL